MAVFTLDHDFALGVLVHAASALHQKLYHWQALVLRCFLTQRALLIVKSERFKAVSMHLMAAPKRHSQARPEIVHDLIAARAGVLPIVTVVVFRCDVHADFADVAMEEVLTAACLACATLVAVEYILAQIVVE